MRAVILLAALASCLPTTPARASVAQALGMGSTAAAMGGAFTGRADDSSAIYYNPAGLALLESAELALSPLWVLPKLWVSDAGTERDAAGGEGLSGFFFALAGPAGRLVDLPRVAMGLSLYLPFDDLVRIRVPARADARRFPLFSERLHRLGASPALAVRIADGLSVGVAADVFLSLAGPTSATYRPKPVHAEQESLEVQVTRTLSLAPSFSGGVLYAPGAGWRLGLSYHHRQYAGSESPSVLYFGATDTPTLDTDVRYVQFFSPSQLTLGVTYRPLEWLMMSVDVEHARWSEFLTSTAEEPTPPFDDVLVLRAGAAVSPARWVELLIGYGYWPTPVPEQRAVSNMLDSDRHVVTGGARMELGAAFALAVHAQLHLLAAGHTRKDAALLPDADLDAPGQQIDEIGYPEYGHGGHMLSLGCTLSWRP